MYAGSLELEISDDALGTFTVGLFDSSRLRNSDGYFIPLLGLVPAKITVLPCTGGDCQPNGMPDDCEISLGLAQDCDLDGVPDDCQGDSDGDGLIDPCDLCPSDPGKIDPGDCGCGFPDVDTDRDGLANCIDPCPYDPANDEDHDGVCVPTDGCPIDPAKTKPGVCGCGIPDTDSDLDGVPNCIDPCPVEFVNDEDGDGVCAPQDGCPRDAGKLAPGPCGCGVPDIDTDGDTIFDCQDRCPGDDDRIDNDGNGTPDCLDIVPTVSQWGAVVLLLSLLALAKAAWRPRASR